MLNCPRLPPISEARQKGLTGSFLELVVSNPRFDGESVRYTLRKPFAILAEMRGSADWRTRAEESRTSVDAPKRLDPYDSGAIGCDA